MDKLHNRTHTLGITYWGKKVRGVRGIHAGVGVAGFSFGELTLAQNIPQHTHRIQKHAQDRDHHHWC